MAALPPNLSVDATPLPGFGTSGIDPRMVEAWCAWLDKLATDAEAAMAAALAYSELDPAGRNRWLSALEHDAKRLNVPPIALYAPLLSVESESKRRQRIIAAIGTVDPAAAPTRPPRALKGIQRDRVRVAAIIAPLYLDFVQVLACGYDGSGIRWVRHDPIVVDGKAPRAGDALGDVVLESADLEPVIDDLALAIVQEARAKREIPEALKVFADLFAPVFGR